MVKFILIATLIIVILIGAGILFARRFSIARIVGFSMYPTFKPNQLVLVDRKADFSPQPLMKDKLAGKVVIFPQPMSSILVIKRITEICVDQYFWVEGDNKAPGESIDSRTYGFIEAKDILGEVVPWLNLLSLMKMGLQKQLRKVVRF